MPYKSLIHIAQNFFLVVVLFALSPVFSNATKATASDEEALTITNFSPSVVCANNPVDIVVSGSDFVDVADVLIGATSVGYVVDSPTQITIKNINGASTGRIRVITSTDDILSINSLTIDLVTASLSSSAFGAVCEGDTVTFTASGGDEYQFLLNGNPISGFTINSTYTSTSFDNGDEVSVRVRNSSTGCEDTSSAIPVLVEALPNPTLTSNKPGNTVCEGESMVFSATDGDQYQFYINGLVYGSKSTSNTLSVNTLNDGDTISVEAFNSLDCGTTSSEITVSVLSKPADAGAISGDFSVCKGDSGVVYSVNAIPGANSYEWMIPTGASVVGVSNGESITVDFGTNSISGNISVKGINSCGEGVSSSASIVVNSLPEAATAIVGNASVDQTTTSEIYTVATIANATSYVWTVPAGVTVVSGTGTNSITLDFTNAQDGVLTVKGVGVCGEGPASPNFSFTVDQLPDDAGSIADSGSTIFKGDTGVVFSVPTIAHATQYIWSLPAGATIVSGNGTNTITVDFTLTASDGLITVYGENSIGQGNPSSYTLTLADIPDAEAGSDRAICVGESTILGGVGTSNSYSWTSSPVDTSISDPNIHNPTVTPTVTTTYTLTETAPDGGQNSDSVIVTVNPLPTVNAGTDQAICLGESVQIGSSENATHSYTWTSSPIDTSISDPNSSNPTVSPLVTTTYTLTETILSTGCSDSQSITITVEQPPVISAGTDDAVCENTSGYVLSSATGPNTGVTYLWETIGGDGNFDDATNRNPTYNPGPTDIANGSVVLQLNANNTTGACTSIISQDQITLTLVAEPTLDAGPGSTICGSETYQLNATATNYSSISWSSSGSPGTLSATNIEDPIYTPTNADILAGSVTLTVEVFPNTNCGNTPLSESVVVNLTPPPFVDAGSNVTICSGSDVTLNTATEENTSSLLWTTSGDGSFTAPTSLYATYSPGPNDITNGSVVLQISGDGSGLCGYPAVDQMLLTINQDAVIDAGLDGVLCEGPTTLSGASAFNYNTLTWDHNGDGTLTNRNSLTPVYEPSGTDFNGTVTFTLTATSDAPCGANPVSTVTYSVVAAPEVNAGPDVEICENGSFYIASATNNNTSSILWTTNGTGNFDDNGNPTPVYNPSPADIASGSVRLTIRGEQPPCTPVEDFMILTIVKEASVIASADQTICQGDQITVSANAQNYSSVSWQQIGGLGTLQNQTTLTPTYESSPNDSGLVTLRVTVQPNSANGSSACGGQVIDEVKIFVTPEPFAEAGPPATICEGESFTFISGTNANNHSSVQWTGGDGTFTEGNTLLPTYDPGPNDRAVGFVALRLTANPNAPCTIPATDEMLLTITKVPQVNAGTPLINLCEDNGPFTITDSSADYYDTIEWTTSGTGTFNSNTAENPEYTPSTADINNGQVTLTLTGRRDPNNCGAENASNRVLQFIKNPTVTAGPDALICDDSEYLLIDANATNYSNVIWLSSGDGTFSNVNDVNPIYTPGPNDIANQTPITLTLTTVPIFPCASGPSSSMTLSFEQATTVDVGDNRLVCEGSALPINLTDGVDATNATGFTWSTSGTGTFTNPNIIDPVYTPSDADINGGIPITLTLTANPTSPCVLDVSDSFDLTVVKNPTANAGGDVSICETGFTITDANVQYYNSLEWIVTNGTGNIINSTTSTPTYIPSAADVSAGTVTLRLTALPNNPCATPAVSERILTIGKEPDVFAGNPETICEGETFTVSTASVDYSTNYVWSSTTGGSFTNETTETPTFTPSAAEIAAGQAILVLTAQSNAPCVDPVSDSVVLTIQNQPDVEAGPNNTICEGDTFVTSGASIDHGINATWTSSSGGSFVNSSEVITTYTPNATDVANGFVDLTLTATGISPCSVTISDTRRLTITPSATVTINPDTGITCETEDYTFQTEQVTLNNETGILWVHNGTGTLTNETTPTPTYSPGPGDAALGQVTITAYVDAGPGCTNPNAFDEFILDVTPVATLDLSNSPLSVCKNSSIILDADALNYDANSIVWTIISGTGSLSNANTLTPTYTPEPDSETVLIRASVTSTNSCTEVVSEAITIQVTQLPQILTLQDDDTSCGVAQYPITGTTTNNNEGSLLWETSGSGSFSNTNTPNPTYTPSSADVTAGSVTLTLTAIADNPCTASANDSDSFVLSLTAEPTANAGADDTTCETGSYTVSDADADNALSYNWFSNTGSGTFTDADTLSPTYTPGSVDLANGYFILTLEVTGNAPCGVVTSEKRVDIIKNPTVDVGSDQNSCADSVFSISGVNVNNYSILSWTTSGTGTFSNPTVSSPNYNPTAADIAAGSVILTLTASANAPCTQSDSDSFVLSFVDEVSVNAGADQTICEDQEVSLTGNGQNYSSLEWSTSGDGTFNSDSISDPIYTPGSNDILLGSVTLTLVANGNPPCTSVQDDLVVIFEKNPEINIGSDITVCEGNDVVISDVNATYHNGLLWSTNGSGDLSDETTLTPRYIPDDGETSVVLTLTAYAQSPCSVDAVQTKNIFIQPAVVVEAGDSATLCQEDGLFTVSTASEFNTSSYSWSAGTGTGTLTNGNTLTPTYEPSLQDYINGSVTLTLTGVGLATCPSVSDSMILTLIPSPTANAGSNASICVGETFTVSGASTNYESSLMWTSDGPGSLSGQTTITPTYTPNPGEYGTVTLTLTAQPLSPCNEAAISQMVLTIDQPAEIDLGVTSDTICQGEDYNLSATVSNHSGTYNWSSTGSGTFVNANTPNPTYQSTAGDASLGSVIISLSVSSQGGCSSNAVASMTLNITKKPTVFAGNDDTICEGDDYLLDDATITNGISPSWATLGDGTFSSTTNPNPTYTPGPNDLINGSVILELTAQPNAPCADEVSDQIELTFTKNPAAFAGADTTMCENSSYIINDASASNYSSVNWIILTGNGTLDNENTPNPTYNSVTGDSVVRLLLTANPNSPCNDVTTDEIEITVIPTATVDAGSQAIICEGSDYTFSNNAMVNNAASYTWIHNGTGILTNNGTLTPTYSPSNGETGTITFTLLATPNSPCSAIVQDTFDLEIQPKAEVSAGVDITICQGSYPVNGMVTHAASYVWSSNGAGYFDDANMLATTYIADSADIAQGYVDLTLTAQNQAPCVGQVSDTFRITFTEEVEVIIGSDATICEGENFVLTNASANNYSNLVWQTSGNGIFDFSSSTTNPTYIPGSNDIASGSVQLTLIANGNGSCPSSSESLLLTIISKPEIDINATNLVFCETVSSITLTGVTGRNYSSLEWVSSGNGTFNDNSTPNPTYNPTSSDIANGVTLSVTAFGTNGCTFTDIDTVNISFANQVSVEAGNNAMICEDDSYIISGADTSSSTYEWKTSGDGMFLGENTLTPTYDPGPADIASGSVVITLEATGNLPCSPLVSDQFTLFISKESSVNAGANAEICETGDYTLSGNGLNYQSVRWITSGDGDFSDEIALDPTYTPGPNDISNGSVTLTLIGYDNLTCGGNSTSSMILYIIPEVIVSAGDNASVCGSGANYVLSDASINTGSYQSLEWSTSNGTGSFIPSPFVPNPEYVHTSTDVINGFVSLTLTVTPNSSCNSGMPISSTMQLSFDSNPSGTGIIAGSTSVCEGDSATYTVSGISDASEYIWNITPTSSAAISSGQGTNAIVVNFTSGGNTIVTVTPVSACGTGTPVTSTVVVSENDEMVLASSNNVQNTCSNSPIDPILYNVNSSVTGVTASGLPAGVTASYSSGAITVSGTPTIANTTPQTFNYTLTTTGGSCLSDSATGSITIEPSEEVNLVPPSSRDEVICEGGTINDIQYSLGANTSGVSLSWGATGAPAGISFDPSTLTFSGTFTNDIDVTTVYSYTLTTQGLTCPDQETGTITVYPDSGIELISALGTDNQTACQNSPIELIRYQLFNASAATISAGSLPPGVSYNVVGNVLTISGTPSTLGTYNYTFTTTGNAGGCSSDSISGTISVDPAVSVTLSSFPNSDNQEICEGDSISTITYDIGNEASGVSVSGLPQGVSYTFSSGILTISGVATQNINSPKVYTYTVTTIGASCNNEVQGTIKVNPNQEIELSSALGSNSQTLCEGEVIDDIEYTLAGGSIGATVTGLPAGVSYSIVADKVLISGSATDLVGTYNYTVTTYGTCDSDQVTGFIEIESSSSITLTSTAQTASQSVCQYSPITDIVYEIDGNAVTGSVSGLPNGLSFNVTAGSTPSKKIVTITGSPTVTGTFQYTVDTVGGCGNSEQGLIEVDPGAYLTLSSAVGGDDQLICELSPIEPIEYTIVGTASSVTSSGLPPGITLTYSSSSNTATLSGTYSGVKLTTTQTFDYTIYSVSTCSSQITGKITIYPTSGIEPKVNVNEISVTPTQTEVKNILCNGAKDGEIFVVLSGGSSSNFITEWSGPNNYSNSSLHIKNLSEGTYTLTLRDMTNINCEFTETFEIVEANPLEINEIQINPLSCNSSSQDGEIQVQVTGGSNTLLKKLRWYRLDDDQSCFTYRLTPVNNDGDSVPDYADADLDEDGNVDSGKNDIDNDGIQDIADADADGNGSIDSGKTDANSDGIDDAFSIGTVSYQVCEAGNTFTTINVTNNDFVNGVLILCAKSNTVTSSANLDHDQDPATPNISSIAVGGGTDSCSAGTFVPLPGLDGSSYVSGLETGIYKLVVSQEDPSGNVFCTDEKSFELVRDAIEYGSITVDSELCQNTPGYITVEITKIRGDVFFFYNDTLVNQSDIELISNETQRAVYQLYIDSPTENASLEIRNEFGCGVLVEQSFLNVSVAEPSFTYTNPELEEYGVISERSFVEFNAINASGYATVEWDFDDSSSLEYGNRVMHQFVLSGSYDVTLTVYNASGCSKSTTQTVIIGDGYSLIIPNVFTPNGDNINERFRPIFSGIKSLTFSVFDKSGNLLYTEEGAVGSNPNITGISILGWDGNNGYAETPFYIFRIEATLINDKKVVKSGTFQILK